MRVKRNTPRPEELSRPELFAVIFVERYLTRQRRRRSPSIREIAEHIGLCPSATYDLVNRLIEWGYLARKDPDKRRARNLVVTRSVIPDDRK